MSYKMITIDRLLVWAYRDQMVHGARPDDLPAELAKRVGVKPRLARSSDGVARGAGGINLGYTAAVDAWRVHAEVLALPAVTLRIPDHELVRRVYVNPIHRQEGLEPAPSREVHLPEIVFGAALRGEGPDWVEEPLADVRRGETIAVYRCDVCHGHPGGRMRCRVCAGLHGKPTICVVGFSGDGPLDVVMARLVYGAWVDALRHLRESLRGMLTGFELSSELPEENPWRARLAA